MSERTGEDPEQRAGQVLNLSEDLQQTLLVAHRQRVASHASDYPADFEERARRLLLTQSNDAKPPDMNSLDAY